MITIVGAGGAVAFGAATLGAAALVGPATPAATTRSNALLQPLQLKVQVFHTCLLTILFCCFLFVTPLQHIHAATLQHPGAANSACAPWCGVGPCTGIILSDAHNNRSLSNAARRDPCVVANKPESLTAICIVDYVPAAVKSGQVRNLGDASGAFQGASCEMGNETGGRLGPEHKVNGQKKPVTNLYGSVPCLCFLFAPVVHLQAFSLPAGAFRGIKR
jgi:hypothetical protein